MTFYPSAIQRAAVSPKSKLTARPPGTGLAKTSDRELPGQRLPRKSRASLPCRIAFVFSARSVVPSVSLHVKKSIRAMRDGRVLTHWERPTIFAGVGSRKVLGLPVRDTMADADPLRCAWADICGICAF